MSLNCKNFVPPYGYFSSASWVTNIRYKLIQWLAGRAVVIVNADISLREVTSEQLAAQVATTVRANFGVFMCNTDLMAPPSKVVFIRDTHTTRNLEPGS